jgi:hypothetical protein
MLFIGECAPIGPYLHNHRLGKRNPKTIHHPQVHTADPLQVLADLFCMLGQVFAVGILLSPGKRFNVACFPSRSCQSIQVPDLLITGLDLLGIKVIEQYRLLQHKKMLFPPSSGECLADLLFTFLAARFAHGCQRLRIPLPCQDRSNDLLPGQSCDVGHCLRKLHVHLQ